jgi:hypothetical protein
MQPDKGCGTREQGNPGLINVGHTNGARPMTLFQGWQINMDKESIRNSINKHFNFLFKKGFKIGAIIQTGNMGCWETILESSRRSGTALVPDNHQHSSANNVCLFI